MSSKEVLKAVALRQKILTMIILRNAGRKIKVECGWARSHLFRNFCFWGLGSQK